MQSVRIAVAGVALDADFALPDRPLGVVLFAHGSGSGRHSPRNRYVAQQLQDAGLATLLADLLTQEEEAVDISTAQFRFDISLLAERLVGLIDWATHDDRTTGAQIGLFGASTGAAAALIAAAERAEQVRAVVSRGGRPDLAGSALRRVEQPTLLIVGERDEVVIELNDKSMKLLPHARMVVVPGATHLFEEPGALEIVARLASDWFREHLEAPPEV